MCYIELMDSRREYKLLKTGRLMFLNDLNTKLSILYFALENVRVFEMGGL